MNGTHFVVGLTFLALATFPASAQTVKGRVLSVEDGDKLLIMTETKQRVRIRIAGIDAPESRQPFSTAATDYLSRLVLGQQVAIEGTKRDRYGYTVGKVLIGERDVGLELIRAGYAWHFKRYEIEQSKVDRERYADAEQAARKKRRGLWQDASPVPPWDWSDAKRDK
jgi:endonuclease YncB( thermonuclease family)